MKLYIVKFMCVSVFEQHPGNKTSVVLICVSLRLVIAPVYQGAETTSVSILVSVAICLFFVPF